MVESLVAVARPVGVMSIRSGILGTTPTEQALNWLIALQEQPDSPEVAARFDAWLEIPENVLAWQEASRVWSVLGDAGEKTRLDRGGRATDRLPVATGPAVTRPRGWLRPRNLAVAAACMAAACLVVLFLPAIEIWLRADYATRTAETREIRLEDGSRVTLGADSAIAVSLATDRRRIRLLTGEAYFEVEPDADRPFQVEAANVVTTVLGTAFDVRRGEDGVGVAVSHGRVGVATIDRGDALGNPLVAGDWINVAADGAIERGVDAPELVGAWRDGMLAVQDRPVREVAEILGRYYDGRIAFTGSDLGGRRVTGIYNLRQPVDALEAVAAAHGARLRRVGPWLTIVSGP